jgi:hypothetical protein
MLQEISDKFGIDKSELYNFLLLNESLHLSNVLKESIKKHIPNEPKRTSKKEEKNEPKHSTDNNYQPDPDKRRKEKIEKLKYMFYHGLQYEKIQAKTILERKFKIFV